MKARQAAATIPAIGMGAPFPALVEERLSSDKLIVTSYSQDPTALNFYGAGAQTQDEMLQKIFRAHDWSPFYDPAWSYLHENEGRGGASGRTAAYATPDPEVVDEVTYYFDDLKDYRKGNRKMGRIVIDTAYGLRILDL